MARMDAPNAGSAPLVAADPGRYRALFDSMDEGFCIIEFFDGPHGPLSDYIHVEANAAYERHAGIANVVGQKLREMVPDEADGWVEMYGAVLATGEPIRFERELVATGRHLAISSFRIEPPELRQVAVLFRDVTERRRAEEALRQINETLEVRVAEALAENAAEQQRRAEAEESLRQAQKMEAVGQLTGGLAHDFNNLLAAISGAFEMIGTRLEQGRIEDVQRYMSAGQAATRRAAGLTHRLLAFARRQTLSPTQVAVERLLEDLSDLIARTVGPGITLETTAAPGLWPTRVDANQLENALLNLAINARDAMPDGGRITIAAGNRRIAAREATSLGLKAGDYVSISVSDTGAGIEPAVLARVFEPFFTTKPTGQGTGLGLSMVYGFAHQSHGAVAVRSEVGQGTTVRLDLPRSLEAADTADAPAAARRPGTAPGAGVALVVDDEAAVRMLIADALTEAGMTVLDAADGPSALRLLEAHQGPVDLLVTDVGLPGGLNGRQVADAARVLRPDLSVLFVTGYAEAAALDGDHLGAGMSVLTKPFTVAALLEAADGVRAG